MITNKRIFRAIGVVLLIVVCLRPQPATANPPVEDPASEVFQSPRELETKITRIADPLLRDVVTQLLCSALAHTPPAEGVGNTEEVMKIYRSSQRVYCNVLGVQATSPDQSVKMSKEIIKDVYEFTLRRLDWIGLKKVKNDDLVKAVQSIRDKYKKMGFDTPAKAVISERVEVVVKG